MLYELE